MRRRRGAPQPKSFDDAFNRIDKLEHSVVTRVVIPDFTVDRALYAMYDANVVDKLKAAFPYIRDLDRTSYITEDLLFPHDNGVVTVVLTVAAKSSGILVPERNNVRPDQIKQYEPLMRVIVDAYEQHTKFEKVRRVVRWLNEHATIGAARHYCPWLVALLPADHPFQAATGLSYREPAVGIGEIMPVMRECAEIVASALLCGNMDDDATKSRFSVAFRGRRDTDNYTSQAFGLI